MKRRRKGNGKEKKERSTLQPTVRHASEEKNEKMKKCEEEQERNGKEEEERSTLQPHDEQDMQEERRRMEDEKRKRAGKEKKRKGRELNYNPQ